MDFSELPLQFDFAQCCVLVKADSQDWNSASSFEVETILLRHFACGKILSIVTNVKIVTNVGKVVGTRRKNVLLSSCSASS